MLHDIILHVVWCLVMAISAHEKVHGPSEKPLSVVCECSGDARRSPDLIRALQTFLDVQRTIPPDTTFVQNVSTCNAHDTCNLTVMNKPGTPRLRPYCFSHMAGFDDEADMWVSRKGCATIKFETDLVSINEVAGRISVATGNSGRKNYIESDRICSTNMCNSA